MNANLENSLADIQLRRLRGEVQWKLFKAPELVRTMTVEQLQQLLAALSQGDK